MGVKELLIKEIESLPDDCLGEVLDFVQFIETRTVGAGRATAIACESSLKKDWLSPEEDQAWQDL